MSVDYWSIEIEDTVTHQWRSENIVRQCAEQRSSCVTHITRAAPLATLWQGEIPRVFNGLQNIGTGITSGVDVAASWSMDALGGTFGVNLAGTYLTEWEIEILPGEAYDCVGLISSRCYPKPEWRHTMTASYDSNSFWAVTARWRYFEGVDYDGALTNGQRVPTQIVQG